MPVRSPLAGRYYPERSGEPPVQPWTTRNSMILHSWPKLKSLRYPLLTTRGSIYPPGTALWDSTSSVQIHIKGGERRYDVTWQRVKRVVVVKRVLSALCLVLYHAHSSTIPTTRNSYSHFYPIFDIPDINPHQEHSQNMHDIFSCSRVYSYRSIFPNIIYVKYLSFSVANHILKLTTVKLV